MGSNIRCSRGAIAIGIASLVLAVAALTPGGFGHAVAQTAGPAPEDPGTSSPPPGGGTTTTTTDGDTQTTTNTSEGQTSTTTSSGASTTTQSDGTTTTTVTNTNTTNSVTVNQGGTTLEVTFPAGTVPSGSTMTIDPLSPGDLPATDPPPADNVIAGVTFMVEASSVVTVSGNVARRIENFASAPGTILGFKGFELDLKSPSGAEVQPAGPVILEWVVPAQALAAAGGNNQNVLLLYFNPATSKWEADGADFMSGNTASFTVRHFSTYAFAIRVAGAVTPAPPAATTPGTVPPVGATPSLPAQTGGTGAGAAVAPGQVMPRPANTGTGIPALDQAGALPIALVMLGLGILGGVVGLQAARRRS